MNTYRSSIFTVCFLIPIAAFSQSISASKDELKFVDRITLVETLADPLKAAQPAYFTATQPKDGTPSYNVQSALGMNLINSLRTQEFNLAFEWHRNTLVKKEQNNFQAGVNYHIIINEYKWPTTSWWSASLQSDLTYSQDAIKGTEGIVARSYITPYFRKPKGVIRFLLPEYIQPDSTTCLYKVLRYEYLASTGLEYMTNYKFDDGVVQENGNIGMLYLDLKLSIYPLPKLTKRKIKAYYNFTDRFDIITRTAKEERILRKYGIAFVLKLPASSTTKRQPEIQIAYEIVHGQDVTRGFEEQQFSQFTLKAKFAATKY